MNSFHLIQYVQHIVITIAIWFISFVMRRANSAEYTNCFLSGKEEYDIVLKEQLEIAKDKIREALDEKDKPLKLLRL